MATSIGLDFGTKRVGIAISDSLGMIASPHKTVHSGEIIEVLKKLISEIKAETIVIGEPRRMSGEPSGIAEQINQFCVHLKRTFPSVQLERVDERFTSSMAAKSLIESGVPKEKRKDKSLLDQVSAAIILQSWLNRKK